MKYMLQAPFYDGSKYSARGEILECEPGAQPKSAVCVEPPAEPEPEPDSQLPLPLPKVEK